MGKRTRGQLSLQPLLGFECNHAMCNNSNKIANSAWKRTASASMKGSSKSTAKKKE
jgi:hypothetical protein